MCAMNKKRKRLKEESLHKDIKDKVKENYEKISEFQKQIKLQKKILKRL